MSSESPASGRSGVPVVRTSLSGRDLLMNPRLNKGTAFTEAERDAFALHGLLPPHIGTLEDQRARRKRALDSRAHRLRQIRNMRDLQDNDETLFYSLIAHNIEELLPIVYTPAVGEGCQRFSEIWRKPRGLFLSYPNKDRIAQILANPATTRCAALWSATASASSASAIRARAAWAFPSAKWRSTPRWAAFPPEHCLPILLDVGTDNEALLHDPIYIGWQHQRIRGQEYDDFVEAFVSAVERRWPHILLQWEDFAGANAARLLERYRDRLCTFNDDIQGTAAVTTATLLAAVNATGIPLREQTIAMFGSGIGGHRHRRSAHRRHERGRAERGAGAQAYLRLQPLRPAGRRRQGHSPRASSRWRASARTLRDGSSRRRAPRPEQSRCSTWCAMPGSRYWSASAHSPARLLKRLCARWRATLRIR